MIGFVLYFPRVIRPLNLMIKRSDYNGTGVAIRVELATIA